jgi:glycosyltransferase involved in cell wall biosynthesis
MKRKVVFLESAAEMGGVQFSTLYLAQQLDPELWDVLVILPAKGSMLDACQSSGVTTKVCSLPKFISTSFQLGKDRRIPNPAAWLINPILWWVGVRRLLTFLRTQKIHLLVTKGLTSHLIGGAAAHSGGITCLWHLQDFISERYFGLYRRLFNWAARIFPDCIVVDGSPIADQLSEDIKEKTELVFNGVDTEVFSPFQSSDSIRPQLSIPSDALVIGNVARITPWKGQHHLIEAFAEICEHYPSLYLLLVGSPVFDGDVYLQKLKRMVDQLSCKARVIFAGFRKDLPQVLQIMDFFAYTAVEKDTCPLSLLSAYALGLPVLAFDIAGIREVVEEADQLIPVADSHALAQGLRCLIDSDSLCQMLSQRAREKAINAFSLERFVKHMSDVMNKTIEGQKVS